MKRSLIHGLQHKWRMFKFTASFLLLYITCTSANNENRPKCGCWLSWTFSSICGRWKLEVWKYFKFQICIKCFYIRSILGCFSILFRIFSKCGMYSDTLWIFQQVTSATLLFLQQKSWLSSHFKPTKRNAVRTSSQPSLYSNSPRQLEPNISISVRIMVGCIPQCTAKGCLPFE